MRTIAVAKVLIFRLHLTIFRSFLADLSMLNKGLPSPQIFLFGFFFVKPIVRREAAFRFDYPEFCDVAC